MYSKMKESQLFGLNRQSHTADRLNVRDAFSNPQVPFDSFTNDADNKIYDAKLSLFSWLCRAEKLMIIFVTFKLL